MLSKLNKKTQGFTIIEVLIVLAIAGLIMLIVFLAVPALQRNSRNTQRRGDVGRVGSAVQEVLSNNNNDITKVTPTNLRAALGTLAFYTPNTKIDVPGAATITVTNGAAIDEVDVYTNAVCADMASGGGQGAVLGGTTKSIAVVFRVEPDVTASRVCQSL